jgi:hypothetical protein
VGSAFDLQLNLVAGAFGTALADTLRSVAKMPLETARKALEPEGLCVQRGFKRKSFLHRILKASAVACDWVYPRHGCAETLIVDQHSRSEARHVPLHVQQKRFHALSAGIDGCVSGGFDAAAGLAV